MIKSGKGRIGLKEVKMGVQAVYLGYEKITHYKCKDCGKELLTSRGLRPKNKFCDPKCMEYVLGLKLKDLETIKNQKKKEEEGTLKCKKRKYETKIKAIKSIRKQQGARPELCLATLIPYYCKRCDCYHLTSRLT